MGLNVDTLNISLGFSKEQRNEIQSYIPEGISKAGGWVLYPLRGYHLTLLSMPRPEQGLRKKVHKVVQGLVTEHMDCLTGARIEMTKMQITQRKLFIVCRLSDELFAFQRQLRQAVKREVGYWEIFKASRPFHISVAVRQYVEGLPFQQLPTTAGSRLAPDRIAISKRIVLDGQPLFQVKEVFRICSSEDLGIPA